jgi:hypothetical protein
MAGKSKQPGSCGLCKYFNRDVSGNGEGTCEHPAPSLAGKRRTWAYVCFSYEERKEHRA